MRKLFWILLLLSGYVHGQVSDATLTTKSNQIKNETSAGQNTANRVGTLFLDLTNSKANKQEANTWTALQTMTAGSTNAGFKFGTRTTDPSGVTDGQAYYNTATDKLMVADGSAYVEIGGGGSFEYLEVLASPPGSPSQGRIYMDEGSGVTYTYDGITWNRQLQGNIADDYIPIGVSGSLATDAGLKYVGGVTLYTESLRIQDLAGGGSTQMLVVETDGDVAAQTIPAAGTSGSYTPTITDGTNVAAHTTYDLYYTQVGDVVHVFGLVGVDPTSSTTETSISFSLPVASNFSDVDEAGGSGTSQLSGAYAPMFFISNSGTNRVDMYFVSTGTANHPITFSFSYKVI